MDETLLGTNCDKGLLQTATVHFGRNCNKEYYKLRQKFTVLQIVPDTLLKIATSFITICDMHYKIATSFITICDRYYKF